VGLAVAQFSEAGLLEAPVPAGALTLSRRGMVKRLGLTAAMLPVVSSIAAPSALEAASGNSQVFNFTGASQAFVVPAGVTQITVDALGAGEPSAAGLGGEVVATIPVTAGETLIVTVGGTGHLSEAFDSGGFNGGGFAPNGRGSGASDVRRGSTRLIVAGGGGGGGNTLGDGHGGGITGGVGTTGFGGGGGGGTPTAGGVGGAAGPGGTAGTAGASGIGGRGGLGTEISHAGGGGGGGFFGGGGGGGSTSAFGGGGGGGSSYTDPAATNVTHRQGVVGANGAVYITW